MKTEINPLMVLFAFIVVGTTALSVPLNSTQTEYVTPFHKTLKGVYGPQD